MDNYQQNQQEEIEYLCETVDYISKVLEIEADELANNKRDLVSSRKDMWENTVHFTNDFDRLLEMNQYLIEVNNQTANYLGDSRRLKKLQKMKDSPYFGRFDFIEKGFSEKEKIYIGLYNLMDRSTQKVYVHDWRAPISSVFYRYELGEVAYNTPIGISHGEVSLKRQYKIRNCKLNYFFDCSVRITDEILQEVLSHNTSVKMRNIVETIQKEQDIIIRDTDNELVIVQGVAGSGKTSIALHRIAFLLYEGLSSNLLANQVMIVSPHAIFSNYIASVLPELGEENVVQTTYDDIVNDFFKKRFGTETRETQLETQILDRTDHREGIRRASVAFKGSRTYKTILDRLLWHYEHRLIEFEDVYYNGIILATRQQLKNRFLNNEIRIPMAKQLKRIEAMLLDKVHPLQKIRHKRLEKIVEKSEGHEFEIKSFSRLLSIKHAKVFLERLQRFTTVDYWQLYKTLYTRPGLFLKLSKGLELPEDIESIISTMANTLQKDQVSYEDYAPLLYLKLKVEGSDGFSEIKHVVIDEAQDYSLLQYEVFKLLFKNAHYTVLGDIQQAIEKDVNSSLYDSISLIFDKRRMIKLILTKGYRSTYEINRFTQKLLGTEITNASFERHGEEPLVIYKKTAELIDQAIIQRIADYTEQGYESIAVICKTQAEANRIHSRLQKSVKITLIKPQNAIIVKGALVMPAYMAKGLEFDVVIVYGGDKESYSSPLDKKLLYIACSRALHQLVIYHINV